jgi:hypothetical protein
VAEFYSARGRKILRFRGLICHRRSHVAALEIRPLMNAPFTDLCGEHRAEPVPPETHGLVADVDAALGQQVFDLPQRQWISDVHHHREANYLG